MGIRALNSANLVSPVKTLTDPRHTELLQPPEDIFKHGGNKDWATSNKDNGSYASACAAIGLISGCGKAFFVNRDENDPSVVENFFNFVQTAANVSQGNLMY